jgi:hypothetical protein
MDRWHDGVHVGGECRRDTGTNGPVRAPRRHARRGPDSSCLDLVGPGLHGHQGRRDALHAAHGQAGQGADAPATLWSATGAGFQPVNPPLTANFSKKLNCATKMLDTKVVDETSCRCFRLATYQGEYPR